MGALVVSANLHSIPGNQSIRISRSVPLERTLFEPEEDCYVEVICENGNTRIFEERSPGVYEQEMDDSFFQAGSAYRLAVITPEGTHYESSYETLHECPAISSVYFEREDHPTTDPEVVEEGIRFYLDFHMDKENARYLRWEVTETYELHNPDYETQYVDRNLMVRDVRASEKNLTCWVTNNIDGIFTLDLLHVEGPVYRRWPLHFVSGRTQRLHHRYSLLVRQLSLSQEAFWYWNELGKNIQSMGGLFDTQPALTPGNICNVADETERVIGYFSMAGASEKRIFVQSVPGLELNPDPYYCAPTWDPILTRYFPKEKLPLYMANATILGIGESGVVEDWCVDCTLKKNSIAVRPDFW